MQSDSSEYYDLLFITNLPSFYKINLYNELNRKLKLKVIFISNASTIRNKDFYSDNIEFDHCVITNVPFEKRNHLYTAYALIKALFSTKFKRVVYSGWETKEIMFLPFFIAKKRNAIVIESSILETNTRGAVWLLKKLVIKRMGFAYPSGILQKKILDKAGFNGQTYITHGVGISNFTAPTRSSHVFSIEESHSLTFIYVGRLAQEKNLEMLIGVFTKLSHKLIIVGEGPDGERLKANASGNICFKGYVNNRELAILYHTSDCFILPSSSEPWGLVVEEALTMGLPVIVSNKVGCKDDLINSDNGIVFDVDNVNSLNDAIDKMTKNISQFKNGAANYKPGAMAEKQVNAYLSSIK